MAPKCLDGLADDATQERVSLIARLRPSAELYVIAVKSLSLCVLFAALSIAPLRAVVVTPTYDALDRVVFAVIGLVFLPPLLVAILTTWSTVEDILKNRHIEIFHERIVDRSNGFSVSAEDLTQIVLIRAAYGGVLAISFPGSTAGPVRYFRVGALFKKAALDPRLSVAGYRRSDGGSVESAVAEFARRNGINLVAAPPSQSRHVTS